MNLLFWNCYGIANEATVRVVNNLVHVHDPTVLVLLETRISQDKANILCSKFGFSCCYKMKVDGFGGAIWMLW